MTATELVYNPYAFAIHDDPYETYRRLLLMKHRILESRSIVWVLSESEDVQNAFKDLTHSHQQGELALQSRRRRDAGRMNSGK